MPWRDNRSAQAGAGPYRLLRTGNHPHSAPLPAAVDELHGSCRAFIGNVEAGNVIAQFHRQLEGHVDARLIALEAEGYLANRQPGLVHRTHLPGADGWHPAGRIMPDMKAAGIVVCCHQSPRGSASPLSKTVTGREPAASSFKPSRKGLAGTTARSRHSAR